MLDVCVPHERLSSSLWRPANEEASSLHPVPFPNIQCQLPLGKLNCLNNPWQGDRGRITQFSCTKLHVHLCFFRGGCYHNNPKFPLKHQVSKLLSLKWSVINTIWSGWAPRERSGTDWMWQSRSFCARTWRQCCIGKDERNSKGKSYFTAKRLRLPHSISQHLMSLAVCLSRCSPKTASEQEDIN